MTTLYGSDRPRRFWGLLSEADRSAFRAVARPARYAPGEPIFTEGAESTFALVILMGVVKVTRRRGKHDQIIAIRTVDDFVGEGIWSRDERNATVTAVSQVDALRVEAADLRVLLSEFEQVDLALRRTARDRADEPVRRSMDQRDTSSPRRLARLLLDLIDGFGRRAADGSGGYALDLGLTREELSELLGVSERTVQRALAVLRERGAIGAGDRRVVIVMDDDKLRDAARRPPDRTGENRFGR